MIKNILFGVFFCLFIYSCESIKYDPIVEINQSIPDLNKISTASIGDTVVMQGILQQTSGVEILQDSYKNRILKGTYVRIGIQQGYILFKPIISTGASLIPPYVSSPTVFLGLKDTEKGLNNEKDSLVFMGYGGFGNIFSYYTIPNSDYELLKNIKIETENSFQRYLIYTGKEKNILKFTYREFSRDFARPSFTIDVTYDLSESDIIGFKEVRLRVLESSNTHIKYELLSNFK